MRCLFDRAERIRRDYLRFSALNGKFGMSRCLGIVGQEVYNKQL